MNRSTLKSTIIAGAMVIATSFAANAISIKASPTQESRDTLKKGRSDTLKKGSKTKKDTTGKRMKSDSVKKTA